MIILIGGEKGGTGKTTVAVNLAALLAKFNRSAVLIDMDSQETAVLWGKLRALSGMSVPKVRIETLRGRAEQSLKSFAKDYEHVLIDAGGQDSVELRSALLVANKFYSPVRPDQFNLSSLEKIDAIVSEARVYNPKLKSFAFINCASTNPKVTDARHAIEFISRLEHLKYTTTIKDRAAFKKTSYTGLAVHELPRRDLNPDAILELSDFSQRVFKE